MDISLTDFPVKIFPGAAGIIGITFDLFRCGIFRDVLESFVEPEILLRILPDKLFCGIHEFLKDLGMR